MAIFYEARGESGSALAYSRKATAAVLAHRTAESTGTPQTGAVGGLVERRSSYFQRHVANLAVAARKGIEPAPSLAHEAIEVAQWANQSSAAAAVQQMGTRFASGSGALASLVRESQDLAATWRDQDKALLDALSNPEGRHEREGLHERARSTPCAGRSPRPRGGLTQLPHASIRNSPTMPHLHILSRLRPKRCRGCLAPTKHLYSSLRGPTRATFLRLRARVSSGGRFRSARRTWRRRSPPSAAASMSKN